MWLFVLLLALSVAAEVSNPGGFTVIPARITLSPRALSTALKLQNANSSPARFEVKVFLWDEGPRGEQHLSPTREVVFFPTVFSVESGQERLIRLAHVGGVGTAEKSYRMLVNQIPSSEKDSEASTGINSLIHLSLPIFVEPARPEQKASVELSVDHGKLSIEVNNAGNVHLQARTISIKGTDASGAAVYEHELGGWYVLAGTHRFWQVEIPEERCSALAHLNVNAIAEYQNTAKTSSETLSSSIGVKPDSCHQ